MAPGHYEVEVTLGSSRSTDLFRVSAGDETPEICWLYLRTKARAARSWEEYQSLQLARAAVIPENAGPFAELGHRATRDGTLAQAMDYFGRAIAVHQRNRRALARDGKFLASMPAAESLSAPVLRFRGAWCSVAHVYNTATGSPCW